MYLKARAGRVAWKRSFEGTIYAHIEYLGTIVGFLPTLGGRRGPTLPPRANLGSTPPGNAL